jgi:3-oxo-5alpha-steroid 4-dehydrogenase
MMFTRISQWYRSLGEGYAHVEPPLVAGDDFQWDKRVDVAVVGLGGAGVSAAIEAREAGVSVAVLDRFNGGGSTNISGGIVYAGGGTTIQAEAGVDDTPANMFNYLALETGEAVCADTLRQFCQESPATIDWLQARGVPFHASLCPFKTSYPSNNYYYYYSGNEAFAPYSDAATPAPRGHRAHGRGVSGAALFGPLRAAAQRIGVQCLHQHRAAALIKNTEGEVIGVRAMRMPEGSVATWLHGRLYALLIYLRYVSMYAPLVTRLFRKALEQLEQRYSQPVHIRARRGVILSTGGFFFNRAMVAEHAPAHLPGMPLGTIGDDGSGILLGRDAGGATALMDNVSQWRFVNPPQAFVRGVLVDGRGERICNEMLYGAQLAEQIMDKADGRAWLVIDRALAKQALSEIGPSRAMWFQSAAALMYLYLARRKARTLETLATKLDIPPAALAQTVDDYNALSATGAADPMGKPSDHLATLGGGPWYALDCRVDGMVRNPSITLGGLRVQERSGEVLDEHGQPIAGLYAAGRCAVGVASHSYVSGLSIAGCIFSGRRAGRHAAQRPPSSP